MKFCFVRNKDSSIAKNFPGSCILTRVFQFVQSLTNKADYVQEMQQRFNQNNLSRYLGAFLHRTDLSTILADKLKYVDCET